MSKEDISLADVYLCVYETLLFDILLIRSVLECSSVLVS